MMIPNAHKCQEIKKKHLITKNKNMFLFENTKKCKMFLHLYTCVAAYPTATNDDELCIKSSLQRDLWPWTGSISYHYRPLPSSLSRYFSFGRIPFHLKVVD